MLFCPLAYLIALLEDKCREHIYLGSLAKVFLETSSSFSSSLKVFRAQSEWIFQTNGDWTRWTFQNKPLPNLRSLLSTSLRIACPKMARIMRSSPDFPELVSSPILNKQHDQLHCNCLLVSNNSFSSACCYFIINFSVRFPVTHLGKLSVGRFIGLRLKSKLIFGLYSKFVFSIDFTDAKELRLKR